MNSKCNESPGDLKRDISFSGRQQMIKRYKANQVSLQHYKLHYFLGNTLLELFSRPINIWLLIVSIVELSIKFSEGFYIYITVIPLAVMITLTLIKEGIYSYKKYISDLKVNTTPSKVWDGAVFREISTAEIMVGDFVVLYNKERVPADMILLCTGTSENKCFVDSSGILDEKDLTTKYPVEAIRFQLGFENLSEVAYKLKHIKGTATVPLPNADFSNFEGKIKLKVSPSASKIKMKNLLLRDSKIMSTPWVIGLVVYTGNETKAWISSAEIPKKNSTLEKVFNKFTVVACGIVVVIAGISLILSEYVAQEPSFDNAGETFFHFILIYGVLIPVPVYMIIDMIKIVKVIRIEKSLGVTFRNGNVVEDLGRVEYILADKSGTLTEKEINVSMCLFKSQFFSNIEDILDKDTDLEDFGIKDLSSNIETGTLSNQKSLTSDKDHFIRCLAVCNKGYTNDYGESYLTKSADEKVLISTATILGQKLLKRNSKFVTILKDGTESKFSIIGCQSMSKDRKKAHILLHPPDKNYGILYTIGSFEAMDEVVHFQTSQEEEVIDIVKANKQSGIRQLILAYKELPWEEVKTFQDAYRKAKRSPINKEGRVESLFEEIEEDSIYLGLIGLEETVDIDTKVAVTQFKHAGIKLWMLSGDSFESSLSAGLGSGIVDDTIPLLSIHDIKTDEEFLQVAETLIDRFIVNSGLAKQFVRRSSLTVLNEPLYNTSSDKTLNNMNFSSQNLGKTLNNALSSNQISAVGSNEDYVVGFTSGLTNQNRFPSGLSQGNNEILQRAKNIHPLVSKVTNIRAHSFTISKLKISKNFSKYTLFIDSVSLDFGLKNEESMRNLVYLMFCANSICFTSLLPSHKTKIVKLLKNNFSFKPFFLAVGDGGSDVGMIKEAGIGVGILDHEGNQAASASDIVINEFSDLRTLILHNGFDVRYTVKKAMILGGYSLSLIFTLVFLMNFATDFSGSLFIPKSWYIAFYCVFPLASICYISIFDTELTVAELESNLRFYIYGAIDNDIVKRVLAYMSLGILHSSAAVFVYEYGYPNDCGNALNQSTLLYISLLVCLNFVIGLKIRSLTWKTVLGPVFSFTMSIIMIIIQSFNPNSEEFGALRMFSKSPGQILHIIILVAFQIAIALGPCLWQELFFPTYFDIFHAGGKLKVSKKFKKFVKRFSDDLSKVFISTNDTESNSPMESGKFSWISLKFASKSREKKYQTSIMKEKVKLYTVFIVCSVMFFLALLISHASKAKFEILNIAFDGLIIALQTIFGVLIWQVKNEKYLFVIFKGFYVYQIVLLILGTQIILVPPAVFMLIPSTYFLFIVEDWLILIVCNAGLSVSVFFSAFKFYMADPDIHAAYIGVSQYVGIYSISFIGCALIAYLLRVQKLKEFNLIHKVEEEYDKVAGVLDYLLPVFVRKRVKDGVRYIADDQGEVTVLFCYIVGFEKIAAEYSIEELTSLLDELFGKIDSFCELVGVSKIETVGNTYMACAGLKDSDSEMKKYLQFIPHARRAIELGFAILRAAQQLFLKSGEKITLKIGINSGRVTAGVVGFHKPQFSLVGDTVNTASRMASSAVINTIQISKATYELIGESRNFNCIKNLVDVKGKGKMETYTISLQQMREKHESFIENRISASYSSVASMAGFSMAGHESSSEGEEENTNLLDKLQISKTIQLFTSDKGYVDKVQLFKLKCSESEEESEFRKIVQSKNFWINVSGILMGMVCYIVMVITLFVSEIDGSYYILAVIFSFLAIFLLGLGLLLLFIQRKNYYVYAYINTLYLAGLIVSCILYIKFSPSNIVTMMVLFHFQLISCCSGLFFGELFWLELLCTAFWLIILISKDYDEYSLSAFLPVSIYFITVHLYNLYFREKQIRININLASKAHKDLEKIEGLLTQMIPEHVFKHLKEENTVTDIFFQVTVIYADIVGFTPWSSGREAEEIVNMLSMLFTKFDESSVRNKVYKVHTIGDCYVAMGYRGGMRNPVEECENMIKFAYSMIEIIEEVRKEHKELNMRIGLHTGEVIGGIMGTSIVRYDIYGPDVLIANQMESNGIPGKIVISETTKQFLEKAQPKGYEYVFHTEVKALERTCKAYQLVRSKEVNCLV